ncbi:acyl-CoA Delta-9 desaturase-like [Stomoxys calcitrans]|uniref:acyl-CoA Delta-9 desaturase-like n=1 Tax=Stomoxys calcitrans TaxID=35570 RepID=UPI0027E381B4|nr:acyl-CoA Delta-9 desaturase-like [Stomoxys calcitrans]
MAPHERPTSSSQYSKKEIETTGVLFEEDVETNDGGLAKDIESMKNAEKKKLEIIWLRVLFFVIVHIGGFYGAYLSVVSAKWQTNIFALLLGIFASLGITVGSHRLYSHRAFKVNLPLELLILYMQTMCFHLSVYHWVRDHRVHHKYTETEADPHNAKRGFFFSQIGWLLVKKQQEVKEKAKGIDYSDVLNNPLVMFQHRHYFILTLFACYIIPTIVPIYFWNETFLNAFFVSVMLRHVCTVHGIGTINSVAHLYGNRPYDKNYNPTENNIVNILAVGEGFHNYHHVFPWDYKASELGHYALNLGATFIDFFAKIGWAYDLKTVSPQMIRNRVERTGDGSHPIWGWGDKDQSSEEIKNATILNKKVK